jgi:ergothioneine biosynthesis protein EgtB
VLDRDEVADRYARVRARTVALAAPLSAEDAMVQSMPDASPTKWHLAHTTWFFEEFLLARFDPSHRWGDERWRVLFNSYYEGVGPRHARPARGVLSRPSLDDVLAWRRAVDERMLRLLGDATADALAVALLGTHHEEQHQELILSDAKHALWSNPLHPAYAEPSRGRSRAGGSVVEAAPAPGAMAAATKAALAWVGFDEAVVSVGHDGAGFAFDNETPRHRVLIEAFALAARLVTNAEYAAFIEDGGYARAGLWLSDGWGAMQSGGWRAPLYWQRDADGWQTFGMRGPGRLEPAAPVGHVSFYEADAYARWAGARLPTEHEWERVASSRPVDGNFVEGGELAPAPAAHPASAVDEAVVTQLFGDAWEWTASAYLPYPRFRPLGGALGEYNGKFMSGQMVLRGGSCFTPRAHVRATYRNFFPPATRWQMSGIRLARDA